MGWPDGRTVTGQSWGPTRNHVLRHRSPPYTPAVAGPDQQKHGQSHFDKVLCTYALFFKKSTLRAGLFLKPHQNEFIGKIYTTCNMCVRISGGKGPGEYMIEVVVFKRLGSKKRKSEFFEGRPMQW